MIWNISPIFVLALFLFGDFSEGGGRELPPNSLTLEREGYTVVYDTRNKIPVYVYQKFSREGGSVKRGHCHFSEDKDVPESNRAKDSDYLFSGYDRGHMCPAADCCMSQKAMEESFLLSNIAPQTPKLNRGYWSKLEKRVRELAKEYDSLEAFTGALYLPKVGEDGKRRVSYEVIGEGSVAVPTHFFKVLFLKRGGTEETLAYILPNEAVDRERKLDEFVTTVQKVQEVSGVLFVR